MGLAHVLPISVLACRLHKIWLRHAVVYAMAVSSIVSAAWPILGLFLLSLPLSLGLFDDHCALGQTSLYAKDSFVFRMIVAKA